MKGSVGDVGSVGSLFLSTEPYLRSSFVIQNLWSVIQDFFLLKLQLLDYSM